MFWFCQNWFRTNQMGMVWRYLMWFFMAQRSYKNYGIIVLPSGLVETVHTHTLQFLIYTYLDPPWVHTQFSFQVYFLVGIWGKKSHPTGGFRYIYGWGCGSTIPQRVPGDLFQKSSQRFKNSSTRKCLFPKSWGKCLKSIELFFTRRRNIKFVEVEICMQVEYTLGLGSWEPHFVVTQRSLSP